MTSWQDEPSVSIIIPAKNELEGVQTLIPELRSAFGDHAEVILVDDGSNDGTGEAAAKLGARVVRHPHSLGNGAAIKAGARAAAGEILICMDADGQHSPADAVRLKDKLLEGYDMVVGARGNGSQANAGRALANKVYNKLASTIVGQRIDDLTSGFRAVYRERFLSFLFMLPNGFSYPTTITMAFFRSGYSVGYVPINAKRREGKSHIKATRDGFKFLVIIFRVTTLYSPLKVFTPCSGILLIIGISYYLYTYITAGRFTNMGALLLLTAALIFLIGLVSEQATMLLYQNAARRTTRYPHQPVSDDRSAR